MNEEIQQILKEMERLLKLAYLQGKRDGIKACREIDEEIEQRKEELK